MFHGLREFRHRTGFVKIRHCGTVFSGLTIFTLPLMFGCNGFTTIFLLLNTI